MKSSKYIILSFIALTLTLLVVACGNNVAITASKEDSGSEAQEETSISIAEATTRTCSPQELMLWVEDPNNNLRQEKKLGELTFTIQYKPSQYIICKEYDGFDKMTADTLAKESEQLDDMQYFNIRVKIDGFNDEFLKYNLAPSQSYEDRVKYFSFEMQRDLKLVDGTDTLDCALFHFERTFNVAPYGNFMAAFPRPDKNKITTKTFVYNDKYLGSGSVKFLFKATDLKEIPKLSL
ncbi:MAG: hypothetical protein Q8M29_01235 [Bacteroidota bacterium]|nr:hypothetical protein [Bacteroidota bacterium]